MSKFPNQLALVSVSVIALVAAMVAVSERSAHRAEEAALAAAEAEAEAARIAEAEAALATQEPEETAAAETEAAPETEAVETVAEAPSPEAEAEAAADTMAAAADTSAHGHGDAGTAPIASIIAGAAVAQSVDSPAIDATGVNYGLGREALDEEIAAWDIDIRPDGQGLPEGSGDVWTGEEVFIEQCAVCHGDFAEGVGRWPVLAGGIGSLTRDRPVKTVGSYWPYLSTVYDYVYRAMPFGYAQSLEPDDVYAITAYLLYSNGIVEDDFVLSKENFTDVEMPNEDGFFMDDRDEGELMAFSEAPCMSDCKDAVEITARAMVIDVTPESDDGASLETDSAAETETAAAEAPSEAEAPAEADETVEVAQAETEQVVDASTEAPAPDPELVAAGETAFRQCGACHQVGEDAANRVGPHLNDLFGRTAGELDGFRYSSAMADAGAEGLVWTPETLHDFLANPRDYISGTKMSFRGFRDETDIDAVTAYLQTFDE